MRPCEVLGYKPICCTFLYMNFFWSMLKQVSAHIIIHIDASPITDLQYEQFIFLPLGGQSLSHFLCAPKSLIWQCIFAGSH